jgi:hypothetical protein
MMMIIFIRQTIKGGSLKAKGFGDGGLKAIPKLRLRLPPNFNDR